MPLIIDAYIIDAIFFILARHTPRLRSSFFASGAYFLVPPRTPK